MNNLKRIREIYGATQEDVSKATGANRVAISQWETGARNPSRNKLEMLSSYYGIDTEYFYEQELSDPVITMLISNSKNEKEVIKSTRGSINKADCLSNLVSSSSFCDVRSDLASNMKLLLATADTVELKELILTEQLISKMLNRLSALIQLRKDEETRKKRADEQTLFDLLQSFT